MRKPGLFDLENHFAFYGAYHSNPMNVLIHALFVWPIFFTVYGLFYMILDKKAGSLAALLCLACWVGASFLAANLGYSLAWKVVLVAQLLCWTGQFVGHGVFEKRAPALLDNLVQAFVMAPFFVLLEFLQAFFRYEPYPGFHARVKAKIKAEIKEWQAKKQKKVS
ncbi:uncharacterized endoplasmic reticulum membrane protein YGL010W-like isoform X2 [Durio zibethinus]|uniref:Uncharacterized endoplasmic reticulum membrane protein YGL010W-like isoform X2 n=1 Tax=Durio zibethinus TaxID=66656 RepID=A0A6P6AUZ9_DURZI|nr:uncharacterized endoplasmic reticulum membrane protein YGL010W-like isoform X2 [Durio zibethinus]